MKKLLIGLLAVTLVLTGCGKKPVDKQIEFNTYEAKNGSLNTSISITGEVKSNKEYVMEAPYDLEYGMLNISVGNYIEKGEQIGFISPKQIEEMKEGIMDTYNAEIQKLNGMKESNEPIAFIAPKEGYVKNIKVKEGDRIADVMDKYGYLAQIVDAKGEVLYSVVGVDGDVTYVNDVANKKVKAGTTILQATVTKNDFQEQIDKVNELTEKIQFLNENKETGVVINALESGVVSKIHLTRDQGVKMGDKLLTLVDPQDYYVSSSLSEANYSKVSVGQKVLVNISALNKTYEGEISYISNSGEGGSFPIKVSIKDAYDMKLGMTATLKVVTNSYTDRLLVPIDAVFTSSNGTRYVLMDGMTPRDPFVEVDSRASKVEIGATDGINIEIVSGLEAGDKILVPKMLQYIPNDTRFDLENNKNLARGNRPADSKER